MRRIFLGVFVFVGLLSSSCKLFYPDVMFKTKKDFPFAKADTVKNREYRLQPGDKLFMKVLPNGGFDLVDVQEVTQSNITFVGIDYLINPRGYVTLPLIDSIKLTGKTIAEAQKTLQTRYSYYFVNPMVFLKINNRRVIVYPGRGKAVVVPMENENLTLLEVLGYAGGLTPDAKAFHVKLIRGNLANPAIFRFDLSTIEGLKNSSMLVQANDVIYVEPTSNLTAFTSQFGPIASLTFTLVLLFDVIIRTTK